MDAGHFDFELCCQNHLLPQNENDTKTPRFRLLTHRRSLDDDVVVRLRVPAEKEGEQVFYPSFSSLSRVASHG